MNTTRWPLAPQQEYMLANLAFRTLSPDVRFRNPFLALRVTGPFNVDRIAAAVDVLARHHGVLRTELDATARTSMRLRDDPGVGYFEFDPQCMVPHVALAEQEWQVPEPTRAPLWRVKVIRIAPQIHLVSLTFCHLIWDGISMRTFLNLLSAEYTHPGSTALPRQYGEFAETAERERVDRRSKGFGEQDVLPTVAEAVQERRRLCSEVTALDTRRLAFSIGRHGMDRIRLTRSTHGVSSPFFVVLQAYLGTAAAAFGRRSLVTAFATSRIDLRPAEDCLGYFSDLSLGVLRTGSPAEQWKSAVDQPGARLRLLSPALSWSELTAAVGTVTYPQELYDVWARGPVFGNVSDWAEIFPGAQAAVLSLTPSWRMTVTDATQRRVLAGHTIPSIVIDDLREGTGYLEFNAATVSRRKVKTLVEAFVTELHDGERGSRRGET